MAKERTEAQKRALREANEKRRREAIARRQQKALAAQDGGGSLEGASPVVSSAPGPGPMGLDPFAMGVVPPSDSAPADGDGLEEPPGYAERLREAVADRPPKSGGGTGPKPTEREWTTFFGEKVLRWAMIFYVSWLTSPLEWDTDSQRQLIAPEADRRTMVQPLARLMAQSELNERIGRKILDLDDGLDALIMFGLWLDSTRPVFRERQRAVAAERQQRNPQPAPHYAAPPTEEETYESGGPGPSGTGPGATVSGYPFGVIPGGSGA